MGLLNRFSENHFLKFLSSTALCTFPEAPIGFPKKFCSPFVAVSNPYMLSLMIPPSSIEPMSSSGIASSSTMSQLMRSALFTAF